MLLILSKLLALLEALLCQNNYIVVYNVPDFLDCSLSHGQAPWEVSLFEMGQMVIAASFCTVIWKKSTL